MAMRDERVKLTDVEKARRSKDYDEAKANGTVERIQDKEALREALLGHRTR